MTRPLILAADDEPEILELLALMLPEFEILGALDTPSALELLRKHPSCELLITDVRMPGPSGITLAREARTLCPQIPIIVITGHFQDRPSEAELPRIELLMKPFRRKQIREAVAGALRLRLE